MRSNETTMLQRLIDSGASVNAQDFGGQTAFGWAASSDATDCGAPPHPPCLHRLCLPVSTSDTDDWMA